MKKTIAMVSVLVIVFLCSSFPVFAGESLHYEENYVVSHSFQDNKIYDNVVGIVYKPRLLDYDYNFIIGRTYYGTSSSPYPSNPYNWNSSGTTYFYDVAVDVVYDLHNEGDFYAVATNGFIALNPKFTFVETPACWYYEILTPGFDILNLTRLGDFRFTPQDTQFQYNGKPAIGRGGILHFSVRYHFLYYYTLGAQNGTTYPQINGTPMSSSNFLNIDEILCPNPTNWVFSGNVDAYQNQNLTIWQLKEYLKLIFNKMPDSNQAYQDVQNDSATVDTGSSGLETQSETNHQTELSYFNQTNTALNNSGISNYSFDNEQIGGIGSVSNDFTAVWNSLGSWSSVYIFSLTLSLGLAIIRHVRPIQRSKEE